MICLIVYENDISFNKYQTKIKPIAFYYPEYINISYTKYFNIKNNVTRLKTRKIEKLIQEQTKLAKCHGIYGFAIYFDIFNQNYYNDIINNFLLDETNFPFFLIWKNDNLENIDNKIIDELINYLKEYMISSNYIKIKGKPILSISKPPACYSTKNIISDIRKKSKQNKIGEIFILYPFTDNLKEKHFLTEFDAAYDFSSIDLIEHAIIKPNILYYSGIIYKNLILNKMNFNFSLFRSCNLNYKSFQDYSPEKFYIANNLIFEWEKSNYKQNEGIVFIDSWNNYKNGKYLEPDEIYGYASLNSFSKSIFNISFHKYNNISYIFQKITIAIQIHVYYEDLLIEIINKLNIIPFKYDLYISTISEEKKKVIEKCLLHSNANNYEIRIFPNKGRDVFPFISQMKTKFQKYKYICHIHTKKSNHKSLLGANWRNYIYYNLFGNKNIISEIMLDFESNQNLGFLFPEIYYDLIKDIFGFDNINFSLNKPNEKYMNFIIQKIFKTFKIGEKLDFPAGNMFWAKTKAIYPFFKLNLKNISTNNFQLILENNLEKIWIYIIKFNGYLYKKIFKHL